MLKTKVTMTPSNPGQRVRQIAEKLADRREVLQEAKMYMIQRWNTNFLFHGAIYGGWAPNSSWKEPGGMLEGNTGQLVSYFAAANASGRVTNEDVSWHFQHEYAVTHSTSGLNPNPIGRKVPQRIIWDMNGEDRQHITKLVENWIVEKVDF